MDEYLIQGNTLTDIADAIREKTGDSALMTPAEMVEAIEGIETGGGGGAPVTTVTITEAVSTVTGTYNALKSACIAAVGDVPFIARFKSGILPNYCLYELRYTPEDVANYFQTPTAQTGYGAYVQMIRSPYDGYFNYKIGLRESKLQNIYSFDISADTVYEVIDISALYESIN